MKNEIRFKNHRISNRVSIVSYSDKTFSLKIQDAVGFIYIRGLNKKNAQKIRKALSGVR